MKKFFCFKVIDTLRSTTLVLVIFRGHFKILNFKYEKFKHDFPWIDDFF